ncbi:MAG: PQQ-binding-like beta-propeller repeat protein [Acidimicrobiia bacterium]
MTTLLTVILVLAGCSSGTDGAEPTSDRPTGVPPEVARHAADWPLPGRDYRNARAVVDSPISTANVAALEEAWRTPLEGAGVLGNAASTPIVVGDTVYVQDLSSNVRAIDWDTGEIRWETIYDESQIGPNGPAIGWGRLYAVKGTREVVALDVETGDEVWRVELASTETEGIDIQPQVFGGLVLVSTVPISLAGQYAGGDRGVLSALDARTGEVVWSFDTVASEDLWGNPEVNSGGGAWYPPAIDVEAGVVYWGIANPAPFPGTPEFPNGSSRPGRNLYTESVVALDVASGGLLWYAQAIEHDLFDRDLVHTMLVEADGEDVLVATGKLGRVIGHDPASGEVQFDTPVGLHDNDDLATLQGPTTILPGTYGGVLTPPAAADGIVYTASVNAPTTLEPDEPNYLGAELGQLPGTVSAIDVGSGEVLWETMVPGDPLGATLVVNDLVFTATYQGVIYALNRGTGELVWELQAPGGINGWPAVVGDQIVWPIGFAEPATLLALRLS